MFLVNIILVIAVLALVATGVYFYVIKNVERLSVSRPPAGIVRNPISFNPAGIQESREKRYRVSRRDENISEEDDACLAQYNKCMDAVTQAF